MLRETVRAVLGPNLEYGLQMQLDWLRARGPAGLARWNAFLANAWLRDRANRGHYPTLDEAEVRAARKSETVFVFGSGSSLNDLTPAEWASFREHDVFGFNLFCKQRWVPVDFHLFRGGVYGELRWRPFAEQVSGDLRTNPHYARSILFLQDGYFGHFSNRLVGYRLLPPGARVFRYRTARGAGPPSSSLRQGIRHVVGTLDDVVNCAYCLGWKEIVLVGVDLYDNRYFWLAPDETQAIDCATGAVVAGEVGNVRGIRFDEPHNTTRNGVVELMAEWGGLLGREGVRLSVYNPRSLLAQVLPLYRWAPDAPAAAGFDALVRQ